jgi:hypothetical protein
MSRQCANCKAETTRLRVTFDRHGTALFERCPSCAPEDFREPFRDPTDTRIYAGPEAMPNLYKRDRDGVYQAKDELIADTAALWDGGPTSRALAHKRATRRTEPMTQEEIAQSRKWAEQTLTPALRRGGIAAVAAVLNQQHE